MSRILILMILTFFLSELHTRAQKDTATLMRFSLEEAKDYALAHNQNIKNAQLDIKIADAQVWETTSIGLPQVSASVGYNNNLILSTQLIPAEFFGGEPGTFQEIQFGTQHNATATLSATQLIFNGSYFVGLQTSRIFKDLSKHSLEKTEIEVLATVMQTYYTVLLAQSNKAILDSNLVSLNQTLYETEQLLTQGFVEETDVDQLQITVNTLENSMGALERQVSTSERLLKYQMGLDLDQPIKLTDELNAILTEINLEALSNQELQLQKHIDYILLDTQEKLQQMNLKNEKVSYLPTLNASYTYQEMAQRNDFSFFDFSEEWFPAEILGFTLNIPIFSSGQRNARVNQAKLELKKAQNDLELGATGLKLAAQQARDKYITALNKYYTQKKSIDLAEKILNKTSVKYREGMVSSLELTQANDQYLESESNLTSAIFELLNAKIELDKAYSQLQTN